MEVKSRRAEHVADTRAALLHAARERLHDRNWADNLLAAPAAKSLARLYRSAASVAEHVPSRNESEFNAPTTYAQ